MSKIIPAAGSKPFRSTGKQRMTVKMREKDAEIQKLRMNLVDLTRIIGNLSARLDQTMDIVAQLSAKAVLKEGMSIEGRQPKRASSDQNRAPGPG